MAGVIALVGAGDAPAAIPRTGELTGLSIVNVLGKTQQYGGKMVIGWMITWFPGVQVETTFHHVWRTPDGQLVDVTYPKYDTLPEKGATTFIRLPRHPVDVPADRFMALTDDADVMRLHELQGLIDGGRSEFGRMAQALPMGRPWPELQERRRKEIQAAQAEAYAEIRELRFAISERYHRGLQK